MERQPVPNWRFPERFESTAKKLLSIVIGFALMAVALACANEVWAQKGGVGDITLRPNQSATVNYKLFCTNYGMARGALRP